jgi:hypothetical protein
LGGAYSAKGRAYSRPNHYSLATEGRWEKCLGELAFFRGEEMKSELLLEHP